MKPTAWLIEEFDSTGKLVWYGIVTFEPTDLTWFKDLKSKLHNIVITPLIADTKNIKKINNIKKYDSKRLTEANNGL